MTTAIAGVQCRETELRYRAAFVRRLPRYNKHAQLEVFGTRGDCLRPWLRGGDAVWVDRSLWPEDRDLVLVSMLYRRANQVGFVLGQETVRESAVKQFRRRPDGVEWLDSADGCVSDARHLILGVVVAVYQRGLFRKSVRRMEFPFNPVRS